MLAANVGGTRRGCVGCVLALYGAVYERGPSAAGFGEIVTTRVCGQRPKTGRGTAMQKIAGGERESRRMVR